MRRLTIYLQNVEKENGKINNVKSFIVRNDEEVNHHISMCEEGTYKSHQITNL